MHVKWSSTTEHSGHLWSDIILPHLCTEVKAPPASPAEALSYMYRQQQVGGCSDKCLPTWEGEEDEHFTWDPWVTSCPSFLCHCMRVHFDFTSHGDQQNRDVWRQLQTREKGRDYQYHLWWALLCPQWPAMWRTSAAFTPEEAHRQHATTNNSLQLSFVRSPQIFAFADSNCLTPYPHPSPHIFLICPSQCPSNFHDPAGPFCLHPDSFCSCVHAQYQEGLATSTTMHVEEDTINENISHVHELGELILIPHKAT